MGDFRVARLNNVHDERPRTFPIETIALEIRKGSATLHDLHEESPARTLAEVTDYARELKDIRGQDTYDGIKRDMPQFMPAVNASGRKLDDVISLSGVVCLEWDELEMDTAYAMALLCQCPHTLMAWRSLSGKPKALVRVSDVSIDGAPLNLENMRHAWLDAEMLFEEIGESDRNASLPMQLQNICYDPDVYLNPNATPLAWSIDEETFQERMPSNFGKLQWELIKEIGQEYLDAFDDMVFDEDKGVGNIRVPCPFEKHSSDGWGSRGNATRVIKHADNDFTLQCFKCSKSKRYNATGYFRKPIKLHKRTDLECVTEPIEKAREALRQSFENDERLIGFRADTGIGKTHETISLYQIKGIGGFFSTPTTELAKEVEARLDTAECDVFRWRGLHAEPDGQFPHEKPCMFPDEYRAYAESGRNAYKMLCEPVCPHLDECELHGYRSQEAKAKAALVTVAAHKDLLMNPAFRSTAERLLPKHKNDLIAIDEFNVFEAFIKIEVSQARLEYLRDRWHDHPLGDFAIDLLHACIVQNAPYTGIAAIKEYLKDHPTKQKAIIDGLSSFRRGNTIFSRKEAQGIGADIGQTLEHIRSLPKIEREDWNLLIQLEIFFDRYRHPAGAPIQWKDNTLTFYLPPLPYFTKAKVICMSATLNKVFFEKAFEVRQAKRKDVGFIDAADTEWHPEAKVFQLRTNRNPRHTLLTREKNDKGQWHYTGLTDTGQQALDAILQSAKANPERQHALISYKFVIETYAEQIADAGITTGHFGGLVGLDSHFNRDTDDGIVLHILGAPHEPPDVTKHHYNLLYGDMENPPDFTRDDTTGEYIDSNVQAVYEAGVQSELMQAIGRAGLVKNPSTVVLWTSLELPSVSHRDQTQHFDEVDWMNADGNLDALPATIEAREAQEQAEAEAVESGDVQAVMEATGKSERTAHRKTKSARAQQTANRDAEIIRLHSEGHSQREIERQLKDTHYKASRKVISKVIEVVQNRHAQEGTYLEDVRNAPPSENVEDITVRDEPDAQICDTSVATGELEALDFESETLQLQHATTGGVISVKVLSRPQPRGITQDWKQARKDAITNDITALYHDGEPPSEIASFLGIPEPFVNTVIASLDF